MDLEKIKQLRKSADIAIGDMAEKLGYKSPNGYFYLERGISQFTAVMLADVAEMFDVPIEELFVNEEYESTNK